MSVVATTKEKVQRILPDLGNPMLDSQGRLSLQCGSARIFVEVEELGSDQSWVRLTCPLLQEITPSPALFEYVAMNADRFKYGALSATKDDQGQVHLWMTHGLLGTYLDPDELKIAVSLLVQSADELDDELKARFGGVRFHE